MKSIKSIKQLVIAGLLLQSGINIAVSKFAKEGQELQQAFFGRNEKKEEDSKLIIAALKGNLKDLEIALNDPKVKVDEIGKISRKTALMLSCQNGHKRMVEMLISKGANPHVLSEWGCNSAVREAVKGGHVEILKLLLRNKCEDTRFRLSIGYALIEAVTQGRENLVKLLLASGADPDVEGSADASNSFPSTYALSEAVERGHKGMVLLLLDNKANLNVQSGLSHQTALMTACSKGDEAMIKLLLERGANPDLRDLNGNTAFDHAKDEHRAIIQSFMNKEHHLMSAVVNGNLKAVKDLIAAGANVNAGHKNGVTVLIEAAARGYTDIVKILIDAGANVNDKDAFGFTALIRATEKGSVEIVKALIDKGAARDCDSFKNAYMIASHSRGNAEIAELLANCKPI